MEMKQIDLETLKNLNSRIEYMRATRPILYQDPECKKLLDEANSFADYWLMTYGSEFN